jgi:hypothetical protein
MDAEVINLAWPADDNGTILNRTITYITTNYIAKGLPTDDLFVIVGWSSPERNSFWYKDEKYAGRFRLWPQVRHFDSPPQEEFWQLYVTYMWHPEEYLPRYVMNVLQLQNFLNAHNIKWMCYNSFYQTPGKDVKEWSDLNVREELQKIHSGGAQYHNSTDPDGLRNHLQFLYTDLWNTVDDVRFYRKDEDSNTFYSFIKNSTLEKPFNGWHPSPEAHELWAKELVRYINENNLLNKQ